MSCTPVAGADTYIELAPDHVLRDQIYAVLLTAHERGRELYVRTTSSSEGVCLVSYVQSTN